MIEYTHYIMAFRTLTIDTKGLYFVVKMLLGVVCMAAVWYAWVPIHALLFEDTAVAGADNTLFEAPLLDDKTRELLIAQVLKTVDESADVAKNSIARVFHYVPEKGRFIAIDLVGMEVTLYEDGSRVALLPIVRVPAGGGPDALKEGDFVVDTKRELEVSILTMTRLPYHVRFGDSFAFHGAPTDEQGRAVADGAVGGSVELSDEDAQKVFAFVATGTPLHVRIKSATPPYAAFSSLVPKKESAPATSARAYAIADMARGQVVLEKNADAALPIASITKLFAVAVASESGSRAQVQAPNGEYYTLSDLYYPLLLRSDNAVADTIAAHTGSRVFVARMNNYVRALGMRSTSFADASGLSPRDISSAYDLTSFARHLYLDRRYILDLSKESSMTITSTAGSAWTMENQNKLASDPYFVGGKLGFTDEAGQTALSIFNIPIDGETRTIAVVVLGSKDWKQDTRTLLRWLLEDVEIVK